MGKKTELQGRGMDCFYNPLFKLEWFFIIYVLRHEKYKDRGISLSHRVDPWQLLTHVHYDHRDQLPAEGALGQQGEHGQVSLSPLRLVLQRHLPHLCVHIIPATQTLQRWAWQITRNTSFNPVSLYCLALSAGAYLSLSSSHLPSGWAGTWGSLGRRAAAGALSLPGCPSNPAWGSNLESQRSKHIKQLFFFK